jgi:hypothetical protein
MNDHPIQNGIQPKKPLAGTEGLGFSRLFIFDIGRGVSGLMCLPCLRDREENLK